MCHVNIIIWKKSKINIRFRPYYLICLLQFELSDLISPMIWIRLYLCSTVTTETTRYNKRHYLYKKKWLSINLFNSGINKIHIYVQLHDASVNYLFDYGSCQMIHHDSNWKTHANKRIGNIRKTSLTIKWVLMSYWGTSYIDSPIL